MTWILWILVFVAAWFLVGYALVLHKRKSNWFQGIHCPECGFLSHRVFWFCCPDCGCQKLNRYVPMRWLNGKLQMRGEVKEARK